MTTPTSSTLWDHVAELCDVTHEKIAGRWAQVPAMLDQLAASLSPTGSDGARSAVGSKPPVSTAVLSLLDEVRRATEQELYAAGRAVSADLIEAVRAAAGEAALDADAANEWADRLRQWVGEARAALGYETTVKPVRGVPCPICGAREYLTTRDGDQVRRPALQLVADQDARSGTARCLVCVTEWTVGVPQAA